MIEQLVSWDRDIFFLINRNLSNSFFDLIMPWIREPFVWIPVYLFLIYLCFRWFGKKAWIWVLGAILCVSVSDRIASGAFKPAFKRPRPCHHTHLEQEVILRKRSGCGGAYGFASSHAANHFALSLFLWMLWKRRLKKYQALLLFFWASLISFAQVYVGVHFPADIVAGAMIGMVTAFLIYKLIFLIEQKFLI